MTERTRIQITGGGNVSTCLVQVGRQPALGFKTVQEGRDAARELLAEMGDDKAYIDDRTRGPTDAA